MAGEDISSAMLRALRVGDGAAAGEPVPVTAFVILCHPRCGSELLVQALREHSGMRVYGELFQDEPEARRSAFRGHAEMYESGDDGASFLADRIFAEDDDLENLATGFKLFYGQARDPCARSAWAYILDRTDLRVIHLTRDNPLDSFISLSEAEASGRWVVELAEPLPAGEPIVIDPCRCLEFLDSVYAHREWARRAFRAHDVLELSYERHLDADFGVALRDVQTFLGIPPLALPTLLRKQGARPIGERIANHEEIRNSLRCTIHAQAPSTPASRGSAV